jgi:hypothetical protein
MSNETDRHMGYFEKMNEVYKRQDLLNALIEQERRILDQWGDCTCASAPLCPFFRRPGELFKDGLPDSIELP